MTYVPRLKSKYKDEIRTALKDKFQYKSVMQVPKLEKSLSTRVLAALLLIRSLLKVQLLN